MDMKLPQKLSTKSYSLTRPCISIFVQNNMIFQVFWLFFKVLSTFAVKYEILSRH